jgi:hypothetical protein
MYLRHVAFAMLVAISTPACHHEPVFDPGERTSGVGGTISGTVRSSDGAGLSTRKITATNTVTGARFEESTASSGGYTMKVPSGTYRLDVELRAGETLATQPEPTRVNVGDLDGQRDFVVTVK